MVCLQAEARVVCRTASGNHGPFWLANAGEGSSLRLDSMSTPVPNDKLTEIEEALRQGRKIDAIKLYRECTGAGLPEAKAAVEQLESGPPSAPGAPGSSGSALPGVQEAIFRGEKIAAIQLYRQQTGAGLAEAKMAVERIEAESRTKSPDKFTTTASGKGCLGMVAALCVLVVAVALWLAGK